MTSSPSPPGFTTTLRATANAGALAGLVWGVLDWIVAASWTTARLGFGDILGCLMASVLLYGMVHVAVLLGASPLLHLVVKGKSLGVRVRVLFGVGLGWGLAAELYWHTKPYLFWGSPALSPERLAVGAASLVVGMSGGWWLARRWSRTPGWWRLLTELLAIASWLLGGLYLVTQANAYEQENRGGLNDRNRDRPNVLLIVVDALRQDVLSCYGHPEVRTPHMDRIAKEGARFANAYVQAPFTTTSFGSLMTGKYPRRHGLLKLVPGVQLPSNVTIAWHLKGARFADGSGELEERDYVAAAFMTGAVTHHSGLDKGFDVYSEAMRGHSMVQLDSAWSTFRSELLLSILWNKLTQQRDFNKAGTTAVDWLEDNADRRFFAWVHLYSTHTPYDPEPEFGDLYADPGYDGPLGDGFWAWHREAIERGDYEAKPADVEQIRDLYYGGTTQADAAIGDLLDVLRRRGVLDDTVVIVTSDHGEDLGEGGRWEHNHMYETNLRVPLLMRYPAVIPAGSVVDGIVDSIDLLPTVCDLLGLALPEDRPDDEEGGTIDGVDGASVLPLLRGETDSLRTHTLAENGVYMSVSDGRWKLVLRHGDLSAAGWEQLRSEVALRAAGDLAAHVAEHPYLGFQPPRLFDLAADPSERSNLFDPDDEVVLALLEDLRAYVARMPIRSEQIDLSARDLEDQMQMLDDIGYGDGGIGEEIGARDGEESADE